MNRYVIAAVICMGVTGALTAQPARAVAASNLSDDERIAARSDRDQAAARVRRAEDLDVARAQGRPPGVRVAGKKMTGDIIVGRLNQELFFPEELLGIMLPGAYADDVKQRTVYREARSRTAASVGLPPYFWAALQPIVAEYLRVSRRARLLRQRAAASEDAAVAAALRRESATIQQSQCARLSAALQQARQTFGRRVFDRFLYEAIAPTAVINLERPETVAELNRFKRGCK